MDSQAMAFLSSKPMGLTTTRWLMPSSSQLRSLTSPLFHVAVPMRYSDPCASLFSQNSNKNSNKSMMKVSGDDQSGRMMLASSNASYAAPLDATSSPGSTFMMRPLAEILRDLNKRAPDQVLKDRSGTGDHKKYIPWYHANRMLSFYAPGWCGEVRGISFSADGSFVTVIYRVTIRGSDGEAFREASSTVSTIQTKAGDPAQKAEAMAFVRACARFGLGLYLHHEEEYEGSSISDLA